MMLMIIDVVADDRDIVDDVVADDVDDDRHIVDDDVDDDRHIVDDDRHIVDDSASRFPSSTGHCYVMVIISAAYFLCTYPYLYE